MIKTDPDYLKCNTNAALVAFALGRYFGDGFSIKYLTNGTKNVLHETNYHEYLMKYFGFRKAYCRLHIKYRGWVGAVVAVLLPEEKGVPNKNMRPLIRFSPPAEERPSIRLRWCV